MPNVGIRKRKIQRSPQARLDLIEVWLFIAQDNVSAADKTLKELEKQMRRLAHTPYMGRQRQDINPTLYSFPVESYLIFYTIGKNGIIVVRVLHSARDIKPIF